MTFRYPQCKRPAALLLLALLLLIPPLSSRAAEPPEVAPAGPHAPAAQAAGESTLAAQPVLAWHRVGSPVPGRDHALG